MDKTIICFMLLYYGSYLFWVVIALICVFDIIKSFVKKENVCKGICGRYMFQKNVLKKHPKTCHVAGIIIMSIWILLTILVGKKLFLPALPNLIQNKYETYECFVTYSAPSYHDFNDFNGQMYASCYNNDIGTIHFNHYSDQPLPIGAKIRVNYYKYIDIGTNVTVIDCCY